MVVIEAVTGLQFDCCYQRYETLATMSFRPLKPTSACTQQSGVRVMPKPEIAFTIGLSITLKPGIQLHSTECPAMISLKIYVVKAVPSRNPAIRFPVSANFPVGS